MKARTFSFVVLAMSLTVPAMVAADKAVTKVETKTASSREALGPAETLTGKIVMVDSKSNLVVVKNSQGTTFDIFVTPGTQLKAADQAIHMKDLSTDTNKAVSVKFVPERSGDVARSIKVNG